MKIIITNAFSLQMLEAGNTIHRVTVRECARPAALLSLADQVESAVGHADTARVLSSVLGREVQVNRVNVTLDRETCLLVGQITGGRLPEGTTTLPEGTTIKFFAVWLSASTKFPWRGSAGAF